MIKRVTFDVQIPDEVDGQAITEEQAVDWIRYRLNAVHVLNDTTLWRYGLEPMVDSVKIETVD